MSEVQAESIDPTLLGYGAPVREERDDGDLEVIGTLPAALDGAYMKNGPNLAFPPRGAHHPFDGDGMVHATYLQNGKARYRNRWTRTPGFLYEQEAGQAVFGGFADLAPPPRDAMNKVGFVKNVANTSIIPHAGKLLVLWEGGMPFALENNLETVGQERFGGRYDGPFTAHPCRDTETGELFAFGYNSFPPFLTYLVIDADGKLAHQEVIEVPKPVMMHDFAITEHHTVFMDAPALFDVQGAIMGTGKMLDWQPELGCRLGVMLRKGSNADVRWFEIEPCYVYHFMNAFEEDGRVYVDASVLPKVNTFGLTDDFAPFQGTLTRFEIDLDSGSVEKRTLFERGFELPRLRDSLVGRPYRYGYGGGFSSAEQRAEFDTSIKFDLETGELQTYVHGEGRFVGETAFVPEPGGTAEDAGWLVGYVYDVAEDRSDLVVLDARDITAGPVATVKLKSRVPAGIHGGWFPGVRP